MVTIYAGRAHDGKNVQQSIWKFALNCRINNFRFAQRTTIENNECILIPKTNVKRICKLIGEYLNFFLNTHTIFFWIQHDWWQKDIADIPNKCRYLCDYIRHAGALIYWNLQSIVFSHHSAVSMLLTSII